jgi:hypothetical protein
MVRAECASAKAGYGGSSPIKSGSVNGVTFGS